MLLTSDPIVGRLLRASHVDYIESVTSSVESNDKLLPLDQSFIMNMCIESFPVQVRIHANLGLNTTVNTTVMDSILPERIP
jgi:hypothetical protein